MIRAVQFDTVTVKYTGSLEDGTVFDRSPEERPLLFILGKDEVIPGFDAAVQGMFQGEQKTVVVPCTQAYGEHKSALIETVERSLLPNDVDLTPGTQLEVTRQDGTIFHVMILKVTDQTVTLDANHPLAGKTLTFTLELLKVEKTSQQAKTAH